jgi:hypothetical protein
MIAGGGFQLESTCEAEKVSECLEYGRLGGVAHLPSPTLRRKQSGRSTKRAP